MKNFNDFDMCNNWKTRPFITIEQNVRFQVGTIGIYRVKCQFDQIQDGLPVATFDFDMLNN